MDNKKQLNKKAAASKNSAVAPSKKAAAPKAVEAPVALCDVLRSQLYAAGNLPDLDQETQEVGAWLTGAVQSGLIQLARSGATGYKIVVDFDNEVLVIGDSIGFSDEIFEEDITDRRMLDMLARLSPEQAAVLRAQLTANWRGQCQVTLYGGDWEAEEDDGEDGGEDEGEDVGTAMEGAVDPAGNPTLDNETGEEAASEPQDGEGEDEDEEEEEEEDEDGNAIPDPENGLVVDVLLF